MKTLKSLCILTLVCLLHIAEAEDNKLDISGELRPRTLLDMGYKKPKLTSDETLSYTTQRTRFNALFTNDKFETYLSIQDIRLWGDDNIYKSNGTFGNTESLSLHQAWGKMNLSKSISLKIGRQMFSYDDQRVLSARNWNDYQVTYDALLLEYKTEAHRLHFAMSYNAANTSNLLLPSSKFKTFDFMHYQFTANKFNITALALLTGNTASDTTDQVFYRSTYGFNGHYKTKSCKARLSAYYQHNLGNNGSKTSAFCISAYAEGKLVDKLHLGVGADYLSGNEASSSTVNRFNILYGRCHSYYGYMDYFSNTPDQGLQDFYSRLTYKPKQNLTTEFCYHYFLLAEKMGATTLQQNQRSKNLGQECDFKLNWLFYDMANLEVGYSFYMTTETLKQLKGVANANITMPSYAYIMLSLKPSFHF